MKKKITHKAKSKRYKVRHWKQRHKTGKRNYADLKKSRDKYVDFHIEEGGKRVGLVNLSPTENREATLEYFEIFPEHQGKGYAGKNIPEVERVLSKEGAKKISLVSYGKYVPFWEKKGFKKTGKTIKGVKEEIFEMNKEI